MRKENELTGTARGIDAFIAKFPNGKERYQKSALFNKAANCLARGYDPEILIGEIIEASDKIVDEFTKYVMNNTGKSTF